MGDNETIEMELRDVARLSDEALLRRNSFAALRVYLDAAERFAQRGVFLELPEDPVARKAANLRELLKRAAAFFAYVRRELDK